MKLRSKTARRPRRWLRWRPSPRQVRIGLCLTAVALVAAPALYVVQRGMPTPLSDAALHAHRQAIAATARAGLTVKEIFVEGRGETRPAEVLAVLDLKRGTPILTFDPAEAKAELENLPWIKSAEVERRLPGTVYVRLIERRPLALWQRHGRLALIDQDGDEIVGADVARFAALPVVVGEDAPPYAATLLALLATEADLQSRVLAAVRVSGRRWNLQLDLGESRTIEVQLPEINPASAWAKLAEAVREGSLFEKNVTAVDLRLPDRLVVRVIREAPPAPPPKRGKSDKKST
jgi:cell division protein FtsQ